MKKLLLILLCLPMLLLAQVPQGVGYQGVATDANGIELVNQSISIRASVLSGSANGTVEWQETHSTTTDTFGLFALTIGQGTSTGNGAQTTFANISWGTNTHFLKIEMDVTGGTNYSFMGTNQMMSVPYALYAESANVNYDSLANIISNDSTFITSIGGGSGSGCNYDFPEGLDGDIITQDLHNNPYTVPANKNLYVNLFSSGQNVYIRVDGVLVKYGYSNYSAQAGRASMIMLSEGQTITSSITNADITTINGYLVDQDYFSECEGGGNSSGNTPAVNSIIYTIDGF